LKITLNMHSEILPLTADQSRQYIDASAVLRAYTDTLKQAAAVRGSMMWRELRGVKKLIRISSTGGQQTVGPDSEENQKIYADFMARKSAATTRLKTITDRIEVQRKLNKVFRVGRTPDVVVKVLNSISRAGLEDKFITVGTHAMYAFESACGVMVGSDALATRDLDLLFDTRKRVAFVSTMQRLDTSLLGVLQKADPTFRVMRDQLQTAVNDAGFEVDIIRRMATDGDPHPMRMSSDEDDLWAVQVPSGHAMLSGRSFEQMVVSTSGEMAMMKTLHPLDFVRVKQELGRRATRDPLKAPKDLLQARLVQQLWDKWLCHRFKDGTQPAPEDGDHPAPS